MNDLITTKSTSLTSAVGQDIELRVTTTSRLMFRPEVVDNPHDQDACVRGNFIFQRKKPSGQWEDYKTLDLSKLKDGEWIKLELKSGELKTLITELDKYYSVFKEYGIRSGEASFAVTPQNAKPIIEQFLKNPENFEKLQDLKIEDLQKLNYVSNINSLKSVLKVWDDNKNNGDESFWQTFFKDNSWVIAQIFPYPVILLEDKAYVGGKSIDNKGGNIVDFIFKNGFSDNVLVVEIKTPTTSLMGSHYRDNAYSISTDLGGSTVQVLKYKDELSKNYYALRQQTDKAFQVFNPKCMVIIGKVVNGLNAEQKTSFELYRGDSKQVEIVTFDELFQKVQMLSDLLEG
ncbi:MAG: hypothetical protein A2427_02280 [Candidatus Nealsonbacteria bacterium RIFOXYC1_FULL_40_7]|uniref:DUF4263 domain-containing protein n=2 Tax=Patescibacteria group TaxID=1783273 RepID=A0A1G2EQS1_9BACT|nr:MAG: hypothetical protein A2363_02840 [Candidatus Gottesmanbacteria bacterium RIFOXYB1_FULL_47_11]OGZ28144.1 MAG: hypothetical protein A2427_02280 [Candidatus Nealsonbacteria bacterium RIFOXYC1_FULL_40_7]